MQDRTLALDDGRALAFTLQGPPDGYPVFYLHGVPGSRREPLLPAAGTSADEVRVIALDRPGYGGSSPHRMDDMAAHAADIAAVADHLRFERFSLFGFSGGGVFALACAAALGDRVRRVVLVATPAIQLLEDPIAEAGELTATAWQKGRDDPQALPAQLAPLAADGDALGEIMLDSMSAADRELLTTPEIRLAYQDNLAAAVAQGPDRAAAAMAQDVVLMMRPWGFDPATLRQPVHVFHGTRDSLLSPAHGRALAGAIPHGCFELGCGCGHYAGVYAGVAPGLWRKALP